MVVRHFKDGCRHAGRLRIENVILGDMTLSNQCDCAQQLIVLVTANRLQRITFKIRLDMDNVISTLVAYNLGGRNVHQLDIFRHDDVGRYLAVHIDFLVGGDLRTNTENTEKEYK